MSYKITQNTDGTWALVNQTTGTAVLSADSADAISIASAGLLGMSRGTLAATGSGASTAAVITKQVTAVTASDGTKAVALPAAATTVGPLMVVNTSTTATLPVYPVSGGNDNINAGAEDAAFTLGAGKSAWFIPTSATQWYVEDASAVTSTTTELNYVDVTTAGTAQASKAVVLDASKNVTGLGSVLSTAPTGGGIGYATGAGGAVTQATNRTTGVTLSTLTGQITTNNASLAAEASADFVVTNTTVAIGDVVVVAIQSGSNGGGTIVSVAVVAAGSFTIRVHNGNVAAGTAETGAIIINFAVIKAVAA